MYTYGILLHSSLSHIIASFENISLDTVARRIAMCTPANPDVQQYAVFDVEVKGLHIDHWTILTREALERKFDFNPDMIDRHITKLVYKDR